MKLQGWLIVWLLLALSACGEAPPAIPPATTATSVPTLAATLPPLPTLPPTHTPAPPPRATPLLPLTPTTTRATIAPTTRPIAATPTRASTDFNLRGVDWFKIVTTDTKLTYDPSVTYPDVDYGPYVTLKTDKALAGHAQIKADEILFGDFSGDGQEEAVISLFSGGTAGNLGLLVYAAVNNQPTLVGSLGGYKMGARAAGNVLQVSHPIYAERDANCCPSGMLEETLRLQHNQLVSVSIKDYGFPEARAQVVEHFYQLLNDKKFDEAWAMLSAAFKAGRSFNAWKNGYASTQTIQAEVQNIADGVSVAITATDKTATSTVTKKYKGTWTLVWFSNARTKMWLLDKATIAEVK